MRSRTRLSWGHSDAGKGSVGAIDYGTEAVLILGRIGPKNERPLEKASTFSLGNPSEYCAQRSAGLLRPVSGFGE